MNQKHQPFTLLFNSNPASYCTMHNEPAMRVDLGENYLVISKQEAMRFFGLVPAPEPKKPIYAVMVEAFCKGAEIQCQHFSWSNNKWTPLMKDAIPAFMAYQEDLDLAWSFRIKPE